MQRNLAKEYLSSGTSWSFKLLDQMAGEGTTAETVFALKDEGIFKGAKRKIKFSLDKVGENKYVRLEEVTDQFAVLGVDPGATCQKKDVNGLKICHSLGGWKGGKRSPRKLLSPEDKSAKTTKYSGAKTPRPRSRNVSAPRNTPRRDQSLILDYITLTPRGGRVDTANEKDEGTSASF